MTIKKTKKNDIQTTSRIKTDISTKRDGLHLPNEIHFSIGLCPQRVAAKFTQCCRQALWLPRQLSKATFLGRNTQKLWKNKTPRIATITRTSRLARILPKRQMEQRRKERQHQIRKP